MRQCHDGPCDHRRILAMGDIGDETAIDLQPVHRQAPQIGERGISRAEIIDRQPDAGLVQGAEDIHRIAHILHHPGFGDFQFKPRGWQPGFVQHFVDQARHIAAAELRGRHVHRHGQRRHSSLVPPDRLPARLAQHPATQLVDQAATFGDRDELVRTHHAVFGVVPAQQRFHPGHPSGAAGHLLLIGHADLAQCDRLAQGMFERCPAMGLLVQHRVEKVEHVAAIALGAVHRQVGVAQQHVRTLGVAREHRNAHRRPHE